MEKGGGGGGGGGETNPHLMHIFYGKLKSAYAIMN